MKNLDESDEFLGLQSTLIRPEHTLHLPKTAYIDKVLELLGMSYSKPSPTLIEAPSNKSYLGSVDYTPVQSPYLESIG